MIRQEFLKLVIASPLSILFGKEKELEEMIFTEEGEEILRMKHYSEYIKNGGHCVAFGIKTTGWVDVTLERNSLDTVRPITTFTVKRLELL